MLALATLVAVSTALVSWGIERKIQADSRAEVGTELNAKLGFTRHAMRSWLAEHQRAARVWADSDVVRDAAIRLSAAGRDPDTLRRHAVQIQLREQLRGLLVRRGYLGYFIIGSDDRSLASSRDHNIGTRNLLAKQPAFLDRVRSGRTATSAPQESDVALPDWNGHLREGLPTMFVGAPIVDAEGDVVATLAFRLDVYASFTDFFRQSHVGSSAETYAFDVHGHLLSMSRFNDQLRRIGLLAADADAMLNLRLADPGVNLLEGAPVPADLAERPLTRMAQSATAGYSGMDLDGYRDYRGVPVVGAWVWDEQLGFGITSEQDVREAYRTLRVTQLAIATLASLAIALVFGLTAVYLTYRRRVAAEKALLVSREQYRRLIEDLQDDYLVYSLDPDGRFRYVSPSCTSILGRTPLELAGRTWRETIDIPPETLEHVDASDAMCRMGLKPEAFDFRYRHPDGELRVLEIRDRPAIDEQGRVIAIEGIAKDITSRVRAAGELRSAKEAAEKANAGKSRFLAAASHDLRQPLHALNLLNRSLERRLGDTAEAAIVGKQATVLRSMGGIVDSLLDINQLESGVIKPEVRDCRVATILSDVHTECRGAALEKGLELRMVSCGAAIRSDPGLLREILRNLVANAIKYTRRGRVLIGCRRLGNLLRIEVWDTGIGIPECERERLFEDFYQVDNPGRDPYRGRGLGLAIVQRLCGLLGHPLEVRSTPGKGSCFAVCVPVGELGEAPTATRAGERTDVVPCHGLVLYVEDDPAIADAVRMLLEIEKIDVVVAGGAGAAIDLVARQGVDPGLIVADFRLEAGMTGLDVIGHLREMLGRPVPALIVTGEIADSVREACARNSIDVLLKPVDSVRLIQTIRAHIGSGDRTPRAGYVARTANASGRGS